MDNGFNNDGEYTLSEDDTNSSELEKLLKKVNSANLTPEEYERADYLISTSKETDRLCLMCGDVAPDYINKSIEGVPYCRPHARYILTKGK